jgi:hypothetical protein
MSTLRLMNVMLRARAKETFTSVESSIQLVTSTTKKGEAAGELQSSEVLIPSVVSIFQIEGANQRGQIGPLNDFTLSPCAFSFFPFFPSLSMASS